MTRQMAPWVPLFTQSCKNNITHDQPFTPFQFATVDTPKHEPPRPRVRTVVYRGFLFDDRRNNVLVFHTDLRSSKLKTESRLFECCFNFSNTWEQFRFDGEWFVISRNGFGGDDRDKLIAKYSVFISDRDRHKPVETRADDDTREAFRPVQAQDWQEEVLRQWNSLSRTAKALYKKPTPGSPLTEETSRQLDKLQRGVDGGKEDAGLENFGIVCLCVQRVDYLNLKGGHSGGSERCIFERRVADASGTRKAGADAEDSAVWEETTVCP